MLFVKKQINYFNKFHFTNPLYYITFTSKSKQYSIMEKKSIFTIEVYNMTGGKFNSVTNTFSSALNALENILCNLQAQSKFEHYQVFIQESKFDKNGLLVMKTKVNRFNLNVFSEFELTNDSHQFHFIAMDLIEKMNKRIELNDGIKWDLLK